MFTVKMNAGGRFTLPRAVREALKLRVGDKIQGTIDDKGRLVLVPARSTSPRNSSRVAP
jgi:bifunctional DNA-binding transcriptional regulator/antitoxin component of YhaV-PrlF toxin-antitoxin module